MFPGKKNKRMSELRSGEQLVYDTLVLAVLFVIVTFGAVCGAVLFLKQGSPWIAAFILLAVAVLWYAILNP